MSTRVSTHLQEEPQDEGHLQQEEGHSQREVGEEECPQIGNEVCVYGCGCGCVCMCAQGEPCTQCVLRVALTIEGTYTCRSLQGDHICYLLSLPLLDILLYFFIVFVSAL